MRAEPPTFAPSADAIEALARDVLARLPEPFRAHLADIVLFVEEFPDEQVVREMALETPFDLLGLYTGRPVGEKSVDLSGALPDMINLYRRPLLDEWIASSESLEALIAHVIVHEVGHHFGLSDAQMHAIEAAAG